MSTVIPASLHPWNVTNFQGWVRGCVKNLTIIYMKSKILSVTYSTRMHVFYVEETHHHVRILVWKATLVTPYSYLQNKMSTKNGGGCRDVVSAGMQELC